MNEQYEVVEEDNIPVWEETIDTTTVDTSNPFIARDIPTPDESFIVIRFSKPDKFGVDFPYLLSMINDSFMSRRNTIVVPGGKMGLAMEVILTPIIQEMIANAK